jgi:hypothetical protein
LFLLRGFLICHVVGWYIELKNLKFSYDVIIINRFSQLGVKCKHVNSYLLNCILINEIRQRLIFNHYFQLNSNSETGLKKDKMLVSF